MAAASLTGLTDQQKRQTCKCQVLGVKIPRDPGSLSWAAVGVEAQGGLGLQPWMGGVHCSLLGCTGPQVLTLPQQEGSSHL